MTSQLLIARQPRATLFRKGRQLSNGIPAAKSILLVGSSAGYLGQNVAKATRQKSYEKPVQVETVQAQMWTHS